MSRHICLLICRLRLLNNLILCLFENQFFVLPYIEISQIEITSIYPIFPSQTTSKTANAIKKISFAHTWIIVLYPTARSTPWKQAAKTSPNSASITINVQYSLMYVLYARGRTNSVPVKKILRSFYKNTVSDLIPVIIGIPSTSIIVSQACSGAIPDECSKTTSFHA